MLLYIDPGTGSMLFTILLGLVGSLFYFFRKVFLGVKFRILGGRQEAISRDKLPFVIFSDDRRYWKVFQPLCRDLLARGQDIVYLTCSEDDPAFTQASDHFHVEFLGRGNQAFAKMNYLNAGVLLSTTPSLDVFQWKRSKDVDYYVHMQHAANDITGYRMFGIDYFDAILLSGDYQVEEVRKLEYLRDLPPKELELIGIPYMDEMEKRLRAQGPVEPHERTILLAPSWGKNSIFNRYGEDIFKALLETGYHIIVRPHPQSYSSEKDLLDRLKAAFPPSDRLEWNDDNDHFQVIRRSDLLLSDFSGIIFDTTLVYDKPLVYADTDFDRSPYDYWWIEEEPWTFSILPEIGIKLNRENLADIKQVIDRAIEDERFAQGREKARQETWQYRGEGSRRACDFLEKKIRAFAPAGQEEDA